MPIDCERRKELITTKMLETVEDFQAVKKGDILAVEYHRDSYKGNKRTRFATYEVAENHYNDGKYNNNEIILQIKNNVYFNFGLFCGIEEGCSNAKSVTLIKQDV
jgi:hypothetical protein